MIRLFILLTLISCGKPKPEKYITYKYEYIENPFDNADNEDRLQQLENRINGIDSALTQNLADMYNLTLQLAAKTQDLQELQTSQNSTEEELIEAQNLIQQLGLLMAEMQVSINEQMEELERLRNEVENL